MPDIEPTAPVAVAVVTGMSETPTATHVHGEAFRLMIYRSDDGTEAEGIWNSRDGVTPFVITLRSGKQAAHVNWSDDRYAPDHKPKPGDRIFVDITQERAREAAQRNAREWWDGNVAGEQQAYESAEALADMLADDYFQPGEPDLIEVPAEPVKVVTASEVAEPTPVNTLASWEMEEADRLALPPEFHLPAWSHATPGSYICDVCWGDGWMTTWPCAPALADRGNVIEAILKGFRRG